MKEKTLIFVLCMMGTLAISYGMIGYKNAIFIIGLVLVIGGYLLIRKKLKESVRNKS